MSFAGLTFLSPIVLFGLLTLPLIWWILRISPPKPRQQIFPPLRILEGVQAEEETPAGTPLWLLLFRLALVALVAIALARPILQAATDGVKKRPTIIIDQSVFSAASWNDMIDEAERITRQAQRDNLDVQLIPTAEIETSGAANKIAYQPAAEVLSRLETLQPVNYMINNHAFDESLIANSDVYSLTSAIGPKDAFWPGRGEFYTPDVQPLLIPGDIRETAQGFDADWYRPSNTASGTHTIEALGQGGGVIATEEIRFSPGADLASVSFTLPVQLRARVARLRQSGVRSAASVKLLDDSFGRPLVAVLRATADTSSPLLSEPFYAKQALQPYADVFEGDLETMLGYQPSILVMPDSQRDDSEAVSEFVKNGGILLRFAGPRLAKRSDTLMPVALRQGERGIGGALAWEDPQKLAAFSAESPFFGLPTPEDVTVAKQVMAEPGIETDSRTWARLEDGSPIVTSSTLGQGRIVLFHVTAGPDWSNLALSGLYVDMLRRILPLAKSRKVETVESVADWQLDRELDAFGRLQSPAIGAQPIPNGQFESTVASSKFRPGYYSQGTRQNALPLTRNSAEIEPLSTPSGATPKTFGKTSETSFMGRLLGIALIALIIDAFFALLASGRLSYLRPQHILPLLLVGILFIPISSFANDGIDRRVEAATGLHLAYIETGDVRRDELSRIAMEGLSEQLNGRTTIEPVGVHGVLPDSKGLELYPFLYWPVRRDTPELSPEARNNINAYMNAGGTVIFDTADEGDRVLRAGQPHPGLQRVTEGLDIPRLIEVPEDHVLTKSFYLLQVFPGRWANGPVYVQATENSSGGRDGVSPVIIGSNDWAAGWAVTAEDGRVIDLEKDIARQSEIAVRFGVNVVMYTLSGNYKSDQVHSAALVERIGRGEAQLPVEVD